jgi:hypothetical protein
MDNINQIAILLISFGEWFIHFSEVRQFSAGHF